MLTVIIMAIVRLYKQARFVALVLILSTILFFVLEITQQIASLNVVVLFNLSRLVFTITLLWAIITLFQKKDAEE